MRFILGTCFVIFLSLVCNTVHIVAQEQSPAPSNEEVPYKLIRYEYIINGTILEAALRYTLELKDDIVFESRATFIEFITQKRIELTNLRQVENTSSLSYDSVWNEKERHFEVTIYFFVESAFSIIALPYVKYNSSEGLVLSLRGRDYNFLGTLERAYIDINYTLDNDTSQSFGTNLGFSYPLSFGNHTIVGAISEGLTYTYLEKFTNRTALAFNYAYSLNPKNDLLLTIEQAHTTILQGAQLELDSNYFSTKLETAYQTILADFIPVINSIRYKPRANVTFSYPITNTYLPDKVSSYVVTLSHILTVGRIDWYNNFRQGIEFSLENPYAYYQYYEGWKLSFVFQNRGFLTPTTFMGLSYRLYAQIEDLYYSKNTDPFPTSTSAAEKLRGIRNDEFDSNNVAILNTDIGFRLFSIPRFAEFHGTIFYDVGLRTVHAETFSLSKDIKHAVGIEGIAFALFSRNFVVRLSYGIDILKILDENTFNILGSGEIDFGLNLHY